MPIADDATSPPTGRAPMTRSEAARHAALVRYGKEQPLSFAQRLAAVQERRKLAKQKAKAGKGKAAAKPKAGAKPKDPAVAARQAARDKERVADRADRLKRQAARDAEHQQDRQARQERQAAADAQRGADRAARQQAQAQRQAEKEKARKEKAKASAGGGAGKPKQSAAASAAQDRAERAQRIAGRVQDLALARGAAGGAVSDRQLAELADAGLVELRGGAAALTEAGAARIGGRAGQPVGKLPAGQDRTARNGPAADATPAPEKGPTAQAMQEAERAGAQAAASARRQSKRHQRRRQSTIANLTATVDEGKAMSLSAHLAARRASRAPAPAVKMTLAPDLLSALNDQITRERYAEASYTAIAAWADAQSFPGLTAWATKSAAEERQHAQRQIGYLNDRARATLQPIDAPETEFGGYAQALQHALDLERTVSQALTDLARQARDAGDVATAVFVETFLPEQVEAEKELSIYLQRVGRGAPIDLLDSELYEEAG